MCLTELCKEKEFYRTFSKRCDKRFSVSNFENIAQSRFHAKAFVWP